MILESPGSQIRPFPSWPIPYQTRSYGRRDREAKMMQQGRDSADKDDMFAGTHEKGTGVAEVGDGSGQAGLKEGGKDHGEK